MPSVRWVWRPGSPSLSKHRNWNYWQSFCRPGGASSDTAVTSYSDSCLCRCILEAQIKVLISFTTGKWFILFSVSRLYFRHLEKVCIKHIIANVSLVVLYSVVGNFCGLECLRYTPCFSSSSTCRTGSFCPFFSELAIKYSSLKQLLKYLCIPHVCSWWIHRYLIGFLFLTLALASGALDYF